MCEQATNTAFIIPNHSGIHSWEKTAGHHSGFTADEDLSMTVFKVLQEVRSSPSDLLTLKCCLEVDVEALEESASSGKQSAKPDRFSLQIAGVFDR